MEYHINLHVLIFKFIITEMAVHTLAGDTYVDPTGFLTTTTPTMYTQEPQAGRKYIREGSEFTAWGRRFLGGLVLFSPIQKGRPSFFTHIQGALLFLPTGGGLVFAIFFPKKCLKHIFLHFRGF